MTLIQVMPDDDAAAVVLRTTEPDTVARVLDSHGVALDHWPLKGDVTPGTGADDLLDRYRAEIDELRARQNLKLVDVVGFHPQDDEAWREKAAQARTTFLEEHRHAEDEVRFFAHGRGCFYLHLDGQVLAVVCEAGDLLSVPAGTQHWFDMGPVPEFVAIRFFEQEDGWVGDFTGEPIAGLFPRLDALLAADPG